MCLEYDAPEAAGPSLTTTFAYGFKPGLSHWAIFMTKEYIGALECVPSLDLDSPTDAYIRVVAVNIATARQTLITTDILREVRIAKFRPRSILTRRDALSFVQDLALGVAHSGTSTVNDDTFILFEDNVISHVFLVPRATLPHNANPDVPPTATLPCHKRATATTWNPSPYTFTPEGALSANDSYGVPAVSLHSMDKETWDNEGRSYNRERNMQVRFWAPELRFFSSFSVEEVGAAAAPALTLAPKWVANVPGALQDSPDSAWKLMLLSHSGRSVLLVMDLDTHLELRLVAVDPELDRCAVHRLAVPPFIELDNVYGLSIDDHRGVITLLDTRGVLFALPYV